MFISQVPRETLSRILSQFAAVPHLLKSGVSTRNAFYGIDHFFDQWSQIQELNKITEPLKPIIKANRSSSEPEVTHKEALEALDQSVLAFNPLVREYADLVLVVTNLSEQIDILLGKKNPIPSPQDAMLFSGQNVISRRRSRRESEENRIIEAVQREATERTAGIVARDISRELARLSAQLAHLRDYLPHSQRSDLANSENTAQRALRQVAKFRQLYLGEELTEEESRLTGNHPEAQAPLASAIEAYKTDVSGSKPLHILVVDDHEGRIGRVRKILEYINHESAFYAANMDVAVEFLDQRPINLLIINKKVGDWSGFTLASLFQESYPHIKVVVQADGLEGRPLPPEEIGKVYFFKPIERAGLREFTDVLKTLFTAAA